MEKNIIFIGDFSHFFPQIHFKDSMAAVQYLNKSKNNNCISLSKVYHVLFKSLILYSYFYDFFFKETICCVRNMSIFCTECRFFLLN